MQPYEIIEHTADVGLRVNGVTLQELFENAALGMFEIIAGKKTQVSIKEHKQIQIKKQVEDFEELLVDWLSELLNIFNRENIIFGNFKISELNNNGIVGQAFGEKINPQQSTFQTEIKAVTFHHLKIQTHSYGFAQVFTCIIIFDV